LSLPSQRKGTRLAFLLIKLLPILEIKCETLFFLRKINKNASKYFLDDCLKVCIAEGRRQEAEGRRQKAEGRCLSEGRRQKADVYQKAEGKRQMSIRRQKADVYQKAEGKRQMGKVYYSGF